MNFKKTAAMLSAACIVFSSLAGCGGSGNGGSGKAEIKSVSLPEKLDGSVIKILAYDGWEQEHADIRKQLKDWYGATVEYTVVDNKDMKNKLAVDLAANITYDMMPMSADLILNNLATPITKYVDLNEDIFKDYKKIGDFVTFNGEVYGMPSVPNMEVIIYNKTLIENLGYDLPLDLYKQGKWNWDTFKRLTTSLCREKTADGDAISAFSSWDTNIFLKANNSGFVKWTDHKYALNLDDNKLREALNYFQSLSTVGAFTGWQGWSQADFQLGTMAMCVDRFGNKTHFVSDLTFDWDFVPFPTGYSGDENVAPGTIATYGVPKGSYNPSGGAAYAYLFCKQDYERRKQYLKGYLTDEQVERFESLYGKISKDYDTIGIENTDALIWDVLSGADITATLESYKTKWQGELDAYTAALPK